MQVLQDDTGFTAYQAGVCVDRSDIVHPPHRKDELIAAAIWGGPGDHPAIAALWNQ